MQERNILSGFYFPHYRHCYFHEIITHFTGGDNHVLYTYTMSSVTYIDSPFIPVNMIKLQRRKGLMNVKVS